MQAIDCPQAANPYEDHDRQWRAYIRRHAEDDALRTDMQYVRRLLQHMQHIQEDK